MAMTTLTIDLVARLANLERDMGKAAHIAEKNAAKMSKAYDDVGRSIKAIFAGYSAAKIWDSLVLQTADAGDQLAKLSIRTGAAAEELSKLQYAASLSDTSNEELGNSLTRLNRLMGEAAEGSKEAADALARFDIKPGTNVLDAFRQIADRVKATGDETRIASALNDVFGRSFQTLVPLLKGGAQGLKESGDELERMGGVMSGDLASASEKFNDNLTKIGTSLDALKIQSMSPVIQWLEALTARLVDATKASGGFFAGLDAWLWTSGSAEKNPGKTIDELNKKLKTLGETRDALSSSSFKRFMNADDIAIVDAQISGLTKELKYLQEVQRSTTPSPKRETGWSSYSGFDQSNGIRGKPDAAKAGTKTSTREQVSEGQRLIQQLRDRLLATQDLTEVEKLQAQFAEARYSKSTAGERDIALSIAAQIDARQGLLVALDAELESVRAISAEYDAQDARLQGLIASTEAGMTAQKMLDEALAESALRSGKVDQTTYDQIMKNISGIQEQTEAVKEQKSAVEELGLTFSSAFEDAIVGGKSFSDVLKGIEQDILRIATRKAVTEPLTTAFSGASSGIGSWLSGLFGNADGGVYSSPSLSSYSGGVFNSPQLFKFAQGGVFGEAGPEAIMPLKRGPDGKLGVSGSGGGVTVNVVNNANGTQATQSARQDAGGKTIIDVMIETVKGAIAQDIGSGGMVAGAMENQYGLNRAAGAWR